jgi:AcrR family transcriptional regulator
VAAADPHILNRVKPKALPRGQHALPRHVVAGAQQRRLHDAAVRAVAEQGYAETTVADIISHAGVSRSTFYEHFTDKEHCVLSAYEEGAEEQFAAVMQAGADAPDDPIERFRASVGSYLAQLATHPDYARVFTIEILAAGRAAHDRRRVAQQRYVDVMRAWHNEMRRARPELGPLPDQVFSTAVTAGNELVAQCIRERGADRLGEIEGLCVYTYLALMGLHEEAQGALESA